MTAILKVDFFAVGLCYLSLKPSLMRGVCRPAPSSGASKAGSGRWILRVEKAEMD